MTLHGDIRTDNYYWMRDDERSDPEVLAWLQAENDYCKQRLKPQQTLQAEVLQEITACIPPRDQSVPYVKNSYRYQSRFEKGNEYAIYSRK